MGRTDAVDWVEAGREFSAEEIGEIRKMVAWLPGLARKELAATVCEHLQWHTAAGPAKLQACQKLLERLEAAGLLELEPVRLEVVTEASDVGLWSEYVERFHPLGYKGAFGYRLRYFIRSGTQRLGCVLLAGAARAIAVGDRWIGWNERARLRNLPRVIDNSRFLIFPHVQILHLASHVLGQLARRASADWQRQWGFSPLLMETFVDPRRYTGTCYRAAGWKLLGQTSGRGLARPGKSYRSTPRLVLVKPLDEDFRWLLCAAPLPGRAVQ
jgi:Druantia protein DruA